MEGVLQILMSFFGSFGFAVLFNLRGGKLVLAALGGALSWSVYLLLAPCIPSEAVRYFFCSFFLAVYGESLARVMKTPATTFLIPSLIPLIPGGSLYHTMRYGLDRQWSMCLSQAFFTLKLALALALGIVAVLSVLGALHILMNRRWYPHARIYKDKEKTP